MQTQTTSSECPAGLVRTSRQLAGGAFTFEMKVRGSPSVVSISVERDITPADFQTWYRRGLFSIDSVMQTDARGKHDVFDSLSSAEVQELQSAAFAEATDTAATMPASPGRKPFPPLPPCPDLAPWQRVKLEMRVVRRSCFPRRWLVERAETPPNGDRAEHPWRMWISDTDARPESDGGVLSNVTFLLTRELYEKLRTVLI